MLPYIIRRIVMAIPVFIGVSIITFSIMQLAPGDPAAILLGGDFLQIATAEDIAAARAATAAVRTRAIIGGSFQSIVTSSITAAPPTAALP